MSLAAILLTPVWVAAAPDVYIKPGSIYSSIVSPCPGDTVQVGFEICNDNAYYSPPGRIIMSVEAVSSNPTLDRFATGGVMDPDTWILVGYSGVLSTPLMTWDQPTVNGGHPLGGVPYTGPACSSSRAVSYTFNMPIAAFNYGTSYRIHIGLSNDSQAPDEATNAMAIAPTTCEPRDRSRFMAPPCDKPRPPWGGHPCRAGPQSRWGLERVKGRTAPCVRAPPGRGARPSVPGSG